MRHLPLEDLKSKLKELEGRLGYTFKKPSLLIEALTHRSFANESDVNFDNERLEFLGDAFINFAVGRELFLKNPEFSEGLLSQKRAEIVRDRTLAEVARDIGLGEFILFGKGEKRNGGESRDSNLADAFEAVIGAVLLDGGVRSATRVVRRLLIKRKKHAPRSAGDME